MSKPRWADNLPPHIKLTSAQISKLEAVRAELGEAHEAFCWHIATHPEGSKMLQRSLFGALRTQYPTLPDGVLLAQIVWSRLMTARMQGEDLFGLAPKISTSNSEPTEADLRTILDYLRQRGLLTIDALAEAIARDEEHLPSDTPPAPQARAAAQRVTDILREP